MRQGADPIHPNSTAIDLRWLSASLPSPVRRGTLVSADSDLAAADIPRLQKLYGAVAADWESGAIARVAARNRTRVLILRGVTDLVGAGGSEAYGRPEVFARATEIVMKKLFAGLSPWLEMAAQP
jgi:adenosylhomocysteine nucleosidase